MKCYKCPKREDISNLKVMPHALAMFMVRSGTTSIVRACELIEGLLTNAVRFGKRNNTLVYHAADWTIITSKDKREVRTMYPSIPPQPPIPGQHAH